MSHPRSTPPISTSLRAAALAVAAVTFTTVLALSDTGSSEPESHSSARTETTAGTNTSALPSSLPSDPGPASTVAPPAPVPALPRPEREPAPDTTVAHATGDRAFSSTVTRRSPGRPGLLWIDDLDERDFGDLLVAQLDGSRPRRLVDGDVVSAVWSADGERIAFLRDDQDVGGSGPVHRYGIYVVNADGTGLRLVTPTAPEPYTWPGGLAWSPDGTTLAYHDGPCTVMGCHVSLWTVDVASGTKTRITAAACDFQPAWSPDGQRIAFVRYAGTASHVWSTAPDGTDLRPVSPLIDAATDPLSDFISSPAWSPDGELIAYDRGWDVWLVRADGSNARPLIDDRPDDLVWRHSPVWAPDGSRLVVLDWGGDGPRRILVASRDGTVERQIATDDALEWAPTWSPDGRMVTAERWGSGTHLPLQHHPIDGSPPSELPVTGRSPRFSPV